MKSMCLELNSRLLEFEQVALEFRASDLRDRFAAKNNKTLGQTIASRRYQHLAQQVNDEYPNSVDMPLGEFLQSLKQTSNDFYRRFLNAYGDDTYGWFCITSQLNNRGIYCYRLNEIVIYIGRCTDKFAKRINQGYGKIAPKNCYLDGQSTNCRMNSLINQHRNQIEFYVCSMQDVNQIVTVERLLIQHYQPQWNISLRHVIK